MCEDMFSALAKECNIEVGFFLKIEIIIKHCGGRKSYM